MEQLIKKYTLDSMTGNGASTVHIFSQVTTESDLPTETVATAASITGCDPDFFVVGQTYLIIVSQFG